VPNDFGLAEEDVRRALSYEPSSPRPAPRSSLYLVTQRATPGGVTPVVVWWAATSGRS
jgi:hypothetical protein